MLFQTCMSFFLVLNFQEDILKNAVIQTVWTSMKVNRDQQLFGS